MSDGLSHVLMPYFIFMRRHHVTVDVSHIPGHLNEVADALSRFKNPPIDLDSASRIDIDVKALMNQSGIHVTQPSGKWQNTDRIR